MESHRIKIDEVGYNRFTMTPNRWIRDFNTPVIAFTADALNGKSNKYIESGFDDYLSKPIIKKELRRILNKYLK